MGRAQAVAEAERQALCDLFDEVGPDRPTLCGDWRTVDLAAHLVVRDRDLLGAPGIVLPGPFEALNRQRMAAAKRRGFPALVATVRRGPALWWRLAPDTANVNEFFVHHEDVRRAGTDAGPRPPDPERDDVLWSLVRSGGRLFARSAPVGVVVRRPSGETATVRDGRASVTVTGEPGELLLFLNGRHAVARVELDGAAEHVAALRATDFGV